MAVLGGEREAVQEPLIGYAQEVGWDYVTPHEALAWRGGETGLLFRELFTKQVKKLNPGFLDDQLVEELIKTISRMPANLEGNFVAWEYLKGLKTIFVPDEKRERNVSLLDVQNVNENVFHVTDEFEYTNGTKTIRTDVVFLINGCPILLVETKSAHKIEGMAEAMDHVRRYHKECPELLAVLQLYAITHIIKYYYSATWNTSEKLLFDWKEEAEGDFERLVKAFLDRKRILKLLTDFILFTRQDGELKKVVLRPHQMRGTDKIVERAASKDKKRALVWHTQGSGKTYTMMVTAVKIMKNPVFENPTVIMLVDRNELESQLFRNLASVGFQQEDIEITSKKALRKALKEDRRGLIVSMIHKFEGLRKDINTRDNIFVLVDEAHRTTGGKLGNYLMGALPNATYIGFTGTPIDKTSYGQGTFITFGKDDPPHGYLDKYSIGESIEDGTTVPLHYALAPNKLLVDKKTLEKEFLELKEAQGISDVEQLNRILDRAVNLKNMLKSPDRRAKVAEYVAKHYRENVKPMGYKAFVVAVDREACALYKDELDKHLPKDYSVVVYSPFYNDPPELAKYHLSEKEEKGIRLAFRKPDVMPRILIVTEKLLTGFDAPILYCIYLDKPMRDHVLLQAIARVNRPYEDSGGRSKKAGLVLDFVGIFGNLEKALAFDSQDIEGVIDDIERLKERFAELMQRGRGEYLVLIEGKSQDKAVEAVLEHFVDEQERHDYYEFFRELSNIYEIISPDAFLRPFLDDFETLARVYRILREAYESGTPIDREFTRKTAQLVQSHTKGGKIKPALQVYKIDGKTLNRLQESKVSDTEKVFNLYRSIATSVLDGAYGAPYLISIGERAEHIVDLHKKRQKNTQEALKEFKKLVDEINTAREEQAKKGMSIEIFSVFWLLKKEGIKNPERSAKEMMGIFEKYPHWRKNESHEREVRKELYHVLLPSMGKHTHKVVEICKRVMRTLKRAAA